MMKLTTSKPPALNHLYGTNQWGGKYLKKDGMNWKGGILWELRMAKKPNWEEPVKMRVDLFTCRHQDVDGVLKILMDTLQEAEIFKDDYWVYDLQVVKHKCHIKDERLEIEVDKINNEDLQ